MNVEKIISIAVEVCTELFWKFRSSGTASSLFLLILANSVPVLGFLYLEWTLAAILVLYWTENLIIGLLNMLRMMIIGASTYRQTRKSSDAGEILGLILFFVFHFGFFTVGHIVFLTMLVPGAYTALIDLRDLSKFAENGLIGTIALLISHGVSFKKYFLNGKEYRELSLGGQMVRPYPRVIVMHTTILFSAFLFVDQEKSGLYVICLWASLKTLVDLIAHIFEHRKKIFKKQKR